MAKKIYSVRWEDADGDQGYYVGMSPKQAQALETVLKQAEAMGAIKDIRVEPIEGNWLLSPKQFLTEFAERYKG